ncbi:MAG: hypothetical protein G8237_13840 [Magnetococcales bacterium]|nr:hypothetical protein [Magnetococcales bacterium]
MTNHHGIRSVFLHWIALFLCVVTLILPARNTLAAEPGATTDPEAKASMPADKGLPVNVRVGLMFVHIESFDDNKETFEATTDLRLSWEDPRLRFPAKEALHGYKEFRLSKADAQAANMWIPNIRFVNRKGESSLTERLIRIFPDGRIVQILRTTATYQTPVDVSKFPFDHQVLAVEVAVAEETIETVDFDFSHEDVSFSRAGPDAKIDGWNLGLVNLRRGLLHGWNGDRMAQVTASLEVQRQASSTISIVFIPLFASLLIPFLATWLNTAEDGDFAVEAFELGNIVIGGLFAVIALSFSISSSYPLIMTSDNAVTRLIGLNYVALAVGVIIAVAFYRYKLPARWFGPCVQDELFKYLTWAFPFLFICTGVAFVLLAMV